MTFTKLQKTNGSISAKSENYQIVVSALNENHAGLTLGEITDILRKERPDRKFPKQHVIRILNQMIADKLIEKKSVHNIPIYVLTEIGKTYYNNLWIIEMNIRRLKNNSANYNNKRGKYSLGYKGINYDTIKDINVKSELFKIFNDTIEGLLVNLDSNISKIPEIIENEKQLNGKMIFAFTIDFNDMKEQFLKRNNKDWLKFGIKWENEEAWSKLFGRDDPK